MSHLSVQCAGIIKRAKSFPSEARLRIVDCLGGVPAVFVGFTPGTPPGQWRRAIKPILDLLVARSNLSGDERLCAGDVSVWQVQGLSSILTEMAVRASSTARPFLGCAEAVEITDTTKRVLTKKLTSRYISAAPMELLEVISKLGIEGEGSIAWAHGMASPHRRAVGADSTAAAS